MNGDVDSSRTPVWVVGARTLTFAQTRKPLSPNSREFWTIIKTALTAPDGQDYFENNLKGSMIPGGAGGVVLLTGTLLSAEPVA